MNNGGKMSAEILFGLAILIMIAAVVIYIRKEDNSYAQTAEGVRMLNSTVDRVERNNKELLQLVDKLTQWQTTQVELNDKLTKRMELVEVRMDAHSRNRSQAIVHKDAPIPQPLQVQITQPIEFIPRKVAPKKAVKK